jgi:hypothetical protein
MALTPKAQQRSVLAVLWFPGKQPLGEVPVLTQQVPALAPVLPPLSQSAL